MNLLLSKYKYMIDYDGSHQNPIYLFGIELGPAWEKLTFELLDLLIGLDNSKSIRLFQIKEKFGSYRFYYDYIGSDESERIRIENQINLYTEKINASCETCGAPGSISNRNRWLKYLCENCNKG